MVSEILSSENWFLILLGLIWITGAVLQDLKRREVDNLWNFSLVAFALGYRLAVSIFSDNYWFILNGALGLGIFLILGNLFYYSKLFAGGDAKLIISLGVILPLSYNWLVNLKIFGGFILLFLICGSVYALLWAFCLVFANFKKFKKEFLRQWKNYEKMFLIALFFSLLWIIFVFILSQNFFFLIGIIILLFPVLFVFAKSVEECCMVKLISPDKLTEGDWLYEDIVVGGKKIKSTWEGVSSSDLELIKKKCKKKILVKYGIPFTPSFLFAFVGLLYVFWRFSFWF